MNKFAKLFEYQDIGQVLVALDQDDNQKPEIQMTYDPDVAGLALSTMKLGGFKTEDSARKAFDLMESPFVYKHVKKVIDETRSIFAGAFEATPDDGDE
jgi:hypothetical protein